MLRTKLHILANSRNRRSITVCSQLILRRAIKRNQHFRLDPRLLSNSEKSDAPKPEPGSEASTSESELQAEIANKKLEEDLANKKQEELIKPKPRFLFDFFGLRAKSVLKASKGNFPSMVLHC
jgi:hypothetical protein